MEAQTNPPYELVPGPGIKIDRIGKDRILSALSKQSGYLPSWKISNGGTFVNVGYGTVNGIEPTIKSVPISGDLKTKVQPKIPLVSFDSEGRCCIAIQVTTDPKTGLIAKKSDSVVDPVTIISTSALGPQGLTTAKKDTWLWPIALILENGFIHKITSFDLQFALGYPMISSGGATTKAVGFFW